MKLLLLDEIKRPPLIFLSFFFFFFLVYASAILVPFAVLDSYRVLYAAMRHEMFDISKMIVEGGRPLYALGNMWVFDAMHGIADLGWLRVASVVGIAALATACYQAMEGDNLPRLVILAFSLLIGLMPSFQVYVAWPTAAFCPWSAFLAGLAYTIIGPARVVRLPRHRMALAVVILTAALAVYQPTAMIFWLFAAIAWLTPPAPPNHRDIFRAATVMAAALASEYALTQGLPLVLYSDTNKYTRTAIVTNIPQKITWFFNNPLLDALNLPLIAPRAWVAHFIIFFIVLGLWLYFQGSPPAIRVARMALAAILLPLAYLPNLLVAENWSSYRTQVALTSLVLLYTIIALVGWLRRLRGQRLLPACLVVAVITCTGLATRNVLLEFVLPQTLEYRIAAHALRETQLEGATHFYFVLARWSDTLAPIVRYDEFGLPSSAATWVPQAMIWLILQAAHSPSADLIPLISAVGEGPAPPGSTVIDFGKVMRE